MPLVGVEASLPFVDKVFENLLVVLNPVLAIVLGIVYYALLVGIFYAIYRVAIFVFVAGLKVYQFWGIIVALMEEPDTIPARIEEFVHGNKPQAKV